MARKPNARFISAKPGPIAAGEAIRHEIEWIPSLGLNLTLRMDGFAWMFALLVSGIGFLVVIYSRYYISPEDSVRRFYLFFLAFTGLVISLWPYIVSPTITLWDAAAAPKSQAFLMVGTLFLMPVILGYVAWSYWVFRGKVRADSGYH